MGSPFNEAGYSQDELRWNGNAQRLNLPFNEAGYSQDGVLQPVTETHQEDSQSNRLSDELVTTGEFLQSSRLEY